MSPGIGEADPDGTGMDPWVPGSTTPLTGRTRGTGIRPRPEVLSVTPASLWRIPGTRDCDGPGLADPGGVGAVVPPRASASGMTIL